MGDPALFLDAKRVGTACCALPEQCELIVRPRVADFEARHLPLPGRMWPGTVEWGLIIRI